MPIKAVKLHYEVRRKLNRLNSDFYTSITTVDLDAIINEAKDLVYENYAAVIEENTTVRNHLRQLEKKNQPLSPAESTTGYSYYKYPKNFYRLMRQVVQAVRAGCDSRELIVRMIQTDDLSDTLKDSYRQPSFDYEETIGDDASDGLIIYKRDFELGKVTIDYLVKLPDIAAPSLVTGGQYRNSNGDLVTEDADLLVDSTYLWRKIVDVAVLVAQRDVNSQLDFELQLKKILALDKLYLS